MERNDEKALAALAQADGAILGWQVDDPVAFVDAHARGVIRFDEDADCYVHPDAVAVGGGGFVMRATA